MTNNDKICYVDPYVIIISPTISENLELVFLFKIQFKVPQFEEQDSCLKCIYASSSIYASQKSATQAAIRYIGVMLAEQTDNLNKLDNELFPSSI